MAQNEAYGRYFEDKCIESRYLNRKKLPHCCCDADEQYLEGKEKKVVLKPA